MGSSFLLWLTFHFLLFPCPDHTPLLSTWKVWHLCSQIFCEGTAMQKLKEQFKSLEKCMLLNSNKPGQPMFKDLAVFISWNTFFTKIKVVPHVTQNPGLLQWKRGLLRQPHPIPIIYPFTQLYHREEESFNTTISFRPLSVVLFLLQIFWRILIQKYSRPLCPRALKNVTCEPNNIWFCT